MFEPVFSLLAYWRIFATIRPGKCDFDLYKKKFDEKNGSNSQNFEKKKLKSPDFYNKFQ
jgi:hypothetical protein